MKNHLKPEADIQNLIKMNTNHADPMTTPAHLQSSYDPMTTPAHLLSSYDPNFSPVIPFITTEMQEFIEMPSSALNSPCALFEPLWAREYDVDIYRTYRSEELKRRVVEVQNLLGGYRSIILNKLRSDTQWFQLHRTTLHLATYFMDCVMDLYTMRTSKVMLVEAVCLVLAAKIEETTVNVPLFSHMNSLLEKEYDPSEYRAAEFRLVRLMNFELIRPTAATFANYFSISMVTLDDFHNYIRNWHSGSLHTEEIFSMEQQPFLPLFTDYNQMLTFLKGKYFEMIDDTLYMPELVNQRPSVLAAACIAAVRRMQCVFPEWTPFLCQLTDYSEDMLIEVIGYLNTHQRDINDTQNMTMLNLQETHCSFDSGICFSNWIANDLSFEESQVVNDDPVGCWNGEQNQQLDTTEEKNQTDMNVTVGDLNDDAEPEVYA